MLEARTRSSLWTGTAISTVGAAGAGDVGIVSRSG